MVKIHLVLQFVMLFTIQTAVKNITAIPTPKQIDDQQADMRNDTYALPMTPKSNLKNVALADQVTTDNQGLPKNAILGLVIGSPILFALIMAPFLLSCSKKRWAERRVRRFQNKSDQNPKHGRVISKTIQSAEEEIAESSIHRQPVKEKNENISDRKSSLDQSETQHNRKKSSLKCNKTIIPEMEDQTGHHTPPIFSTYNRKFANVRPVSVDFGAGISFMRSDRNAYHKLMSGNERKRHSTQVVMESHMKSDPFSHRGMTLLQNLAYEDFIPYGLRIPDCGNVTSVTERRQGKAIPNNRFDRILGERGRIEHQYETISCTSTGMKFKPVRSDNTRLRPPSPIQIKRLSKSEDVTVFPVRYSRYSAQKEIKSVDEEGNRNCNKAVNALTGHIAKVGTDDKKTFSTELFAKDGGGTRERKFWPPPTIKIKRKKMIFQCGKETKAIESCAAVKRSTEREIVSNNKPINEGKNEKVIKPYTRERSKSEPVKSIRKKERENESSIRRAPKISRKEVSKLMEDVSKKRMRKTRRFRVKRAKQKEKNGKTFTNNLHKQVLKNPTEMTRQRQCRVKRKVRKNRRSRDELRHKLQLRLMGYGTSDKTDVNGTAESYKAENNERFSGFIAQSRKLALDANSSDSCAGTESLETGEFLERMKGGSRPSEATLLEEIWKHLNVIAERSRLLKDSSSSRRRSQSLTSSDTPIFKRKRRQPDDDDFQQETSTEEDDDDSDSNDENAFGLSEEITSDYGYCTFNNLSRTCLTSGLQMHRNEGADNTLVGVSLSSSRSKHAGLTNSKIPKTESGSAINDCVRCVLANAKETDAVESAERNTNEKVDVSHYNAQRKKTVGYSVSNENDISKRSQLQSTPPVYENLTEFCSFPSSISSSTSSLAIVSSPNLISSKKSHFSSKDGIQNKIQAGNKHKCATQTDTFLSGRLVMDEAKNKTIITAMKHSVTKSTLCFIDASKGYKMRRRTNSEGNYVVIPPSILLKRRQTTTKLLLTKPYRPSMKLFDKTKHDDLNSDTNRPVTMEFCNPNSAKTIETVFVAETNGLEKQTDEKTVINEANAEFNQLIEHPLQVFMHLQV